MHGQVKHKYRGREEREARDLGRRQRHPSMAGRVQGRTARLNRVDGVSRRALTAGTVCQARVLYRDVVGEKIRPVLVLGCEGDRVVVRVFTTSENQVRRCGGGHEVWLNGRRSWLATEAIELDRSAMVEVLEERFDELVEAEASAFTTVA